MGQIIGGAAKPKRCNLNKLSQIRTPAAGEHILVSSDNSMNAAGQGNFDCYIVGDGTTAATALELHTIADNEILQDSKNSVTGGAVYPLKQIVDEKLGSTTESIQTHNYTEATIHGLPLRTTGELDTSIPASYKTSDFISLENATKIVFTNLFPMQQTSGNKWSGLVLYDSNMALVAALGYKAQAQPVSGVVILEEYPTAKYVRFAPYYNSSGVVDTTGMIEITFVTGDVKELLYKTDIVNDYSGGADKVLSAEVGKELNERISGVNSFDVSILETSSYYIAARYTQTPASGMVQRKTDVSSLSSKKISVKRGDKIVLTTSSVGTAYTYYVTDLYGVILKTSASLSSQNEEFIIEFSDAAFLYVNHSNGTEFALSIEKNTSEYVYTTPKSPYIVLQNDEMKENNGNWTFGAAWSFGSQGATPPSAGSGNWIRNKSAYYSDCRKMRVSVIMGIDTKLMLTNSYGNGITNGEGASAFLIDFANAKIQMFGVPAYKYENGDAQPTSNGVDISIIAEEINIPSGMIGNRKYIVEVEKVSTKSIVRLYDTLTGEMIEVSHDGWYVGRQNELYGFYCAEGTLPTLSDFIVYSVKEPDIVFAGDSITEGVYVADRMRRYAELYRQNHKEKRVVISARGGQTIDGLMSLFESEWNIMRPKIISLLIGANGGNTLAKIETFKSACDAIGAKLYVHYMTCAANGRAENTNASYLPSLEYAGARFDVATADGNAPNATYTNYDSSLYGDAGLHPNVSGQKKMYERLSIDINDFELSE